MLELGSLPLESMHKAGKRKDQRCFSAKSLPQKILSVSENLACRIPFSRMKIASKRVMSIDAQARKFNLKLAPFNIIEPMFLLFRGFWHQRGPRDDNIDTEIKSTTHKI